MRSLSIAGYDDAKERGAEHTPLFAQCQTIVVSFALSPSLPRSHSRFPSLHDITHFQINSTPSLSTTCAPAKVKMKQPYTASVRVHDPKSANIVCVMWVIPWLGVIETNGGAPYEWDDCNSFRCARKTKICTMLIHLLMMTIFVGKIMMNWWCTYIFAFRRSSLLGIAISRTQNAW